MTEVLTGIGKKKSNDGTQWYLQNRIYIGDESISIATCFNPWYVVEESEEKEMDKKLNQIANIYNNDDNSMAGRVYDPNGESPSITTQTGGNTAPKIVEENKQKIAPKKYNGMLRIRKFTPREDWRLMGVKDEDFDKVKDHFSTATLSHLAGDSICVNVLMQIFNKIADNKTEKEVYELWKKDLKKDENS